MGAAYVQSNFNTAVGTTTVTLTGVVTGNTLLVGICSLTAGTTYTVGDTVNTYLNAVGPTTSGTQTTQWFYAKNVTGGSLTVTVTPSTSITTFVVFVEISGADHTTPIQNTDSNTGTGVAIAGNSIVTSGANIYAIQLTTSFSSGPVPNNQTINSPWNQEQNNQFFSPGASAAIADQTVATSGSSVTAASTDTSLNGNWVALTLLLNNASAAVSYGQQVGVFLVGL
jgi:hypothetical protein